MNEMITRRKVREPGLDGGLDGVCVGTGGIEEPGSGASVVWSRSHHAGEAHLWL